MPRPERPLVLDGGTGAALARAGVRSPIAWSGLAAQEAPDLLRAVYGSWLGAGADVLTTNTFATARFVLEAAGCDDVARVQRATLDLALQAARSADREVLVAGSLSNFPPGFAAERYPDPRTETAAYAELAERLAHSVDVLLLEMVEDVEHAARLYRAAEATGLPVWVGVSARRSARRLHPYDFPDRSLGPVLEQVLSWEPALVAVMHTPLADVESALDELGSEVSLGAYPEIGGESSTELVDFFASQERRPLHLVGGCCGSTIEHVAALRQWVDAL